MMSNCRTFPTSSIQLLDVCCKVAESEKLTEFMTDRAPNQNVLASPLDAQALVALYDLRREHPEDAEKIDFVIARMQSLQSEPVDNLQAYYAAPRGALPAVAQKMRAAGVSEREIRRQVRAYQAWIGAVIETGVQSGELYQRLNYLTAR